LGAVASLHLLHVVEVRGIEELRPEDRDKAAIRATAGEPSGYGPFSDARPGVKSGNMHRSAPLSSLFKPEQSLTGVPRLFVALELCSHAGTK
jgi:hypothetical protein